MPIQEIAAQGPKPGDRVQPVNEERHYFISRINREKVYYRWEPSEGHAFKHPEQRFVPLELLKKTKVGSLEIWVEEIPSSSDQSKSTTADVRPYKGKINWHGQVYERETVAPSEARGKNNLIAQFAQLFGVKPAAVHTYIKSKPESFEMEESKG
jgi:hypothetical protein